MTPIHQFFRKNHSTKIILLLFGLTTSCYLLMVLGTIPRIMAFSNGLSIPDMMPTGYTPDYLQHLFAELGKEGRFIYLYRQLPLDLIYPALFAVTYSLLMAHILKKAGLYRGGWLWICLLPWFAATADYLENFSLIMLLLAFPKGSAPIANSASVFTVIKSMATTIYFTALIGLLLFRGVQLWKQKQV